MRIPRNVAVSTAPAILLLAACGGGGGGGGGGAAALGNLSIQGVRLVSKNPNAAHEMRIATGLEATQSYEDVPVTYVLLNAADVNSELDEVRQHQVSSSIFANVSAGAAEYESVVVIPEAVREDGDWYLIAHLDPANVIAETDEGDNEPSDVQKHGLLIGSANTDRADIVLESAQVDQDAVILWPEGATWPPVDGVDDAQDHDFGATLEITTTGSKELADVDLGGTIFVPGAGEYPVKLWDEEQGFFVEEVFTTIAPGVPNSVHLEVFIAGTARREIEHVLRAGGDNVFEVAFRSNRTANHDQWENGVHRYDDREEGDDDLVVEVVIVLPPEPEPDCESLLWDAGLATDWRTSVFSVGVAFDTEANLDERGATAEASARVPVQLFSLSSDAISLRAFANVLPHESGPSDSRFNLDFDVFGVSLFSASSTDPSYEYDDGQEYVKSYEQRGVVFAGPVPIQLRAVATGTVGYNVRGFLDPALMELSATAYADLSAFAEATVNFVVVRAGIVGTVTLLHDELTARASCQLGVPSGGELTGTLDFEVVNDLIGPQGRIYVFEEHTEPKWCWKVVPCGLRTVRNEKNLVNFQSFRKTDVLFHSTETMTVCL